MELIPIYKGAVELKCAADQLATVLEDGWSTEKPAPKPAVAPRPVVKTTAKTESVKKDSDDDDSR